MEGCVANATTLDLIDTNGAVLGTNEEKGSAPPQCFVQQSNQSNLDLRKSDWKVMDRTLIEAYLNDYLITELEFTEALSELSKDTDPCPDKVRYSDIKNLLVDDRSEHFILYEDSFTTGQIPEGQSPNRARTIASSMETVPHTTSVKDSRGRIKLWLFWLIWKMCITEYHSAY